MYRNLQPLLPRAFKWVGISFLIFPTLLLLSSKWFTSVELIHNNLDVIKILILDFFILGLLIVAFSKDKVEDELTLIIRLKAIAFSFIVTIVCVVLQPVFDALWRDPLSEPSGYKIIIGMLFLYLLSFYYYKRMR
jgi:hypothetical protein